MTESHFGTSILRNKPLRSDGAEGADGSGYAGGGLCGLISAATLTGTRLKLRTCSRARAKSGLFPAPRDSSPPNPTLAIRVVNDALENPKSREDFQPALAALVMRGLRLRCPRCGRAAIFQGWFAMHDRCPSCGRTFNRAPGYFLGSIFFNYGVTAVLLVIGYFTLFFSLDRVGHGWLAALAAFSLLFPLWFFRYARALWIAVDERLDPWPNEQERRE